MAETLNIRISINGDGSGGSGNESGGKSKAAAKTNVAKKNAKAYWTLERAQSIAKQFATQLTYGGIGLIGTYTGNYALQEQMQRGLNIGQKIIGIGVSFAMNPVLGAINLVSEGIGLGFEYAQQVRQMQWRNVAASELARRAGYLSDANRGGNGR